MEIIAAEMGVVLDENVFDQFRIADQNARRQELVVANVRSIWECTANGIGVKTEAQQLSLKQEEEKTRQRTCTIGG